ncbi:MAG TPA: DNA replication and repair protein RecF [Solirubrobacterales bacterium]|nr:DNA replication and repair protein RecF [Solirubrobacterales bacterium]
MIVRRLTARAFRSYQRLETEIGERVTVVVGDNGAGKTNLLEALYFGCVGRSCRTRVDNQIVTFGEDVSRVEVEGSQDDHEHTLAVAIDKRAGKTFFADGAKAASLDDVPWRPPVAVFMPDRLDLVKGAPGVRRGHLDQFVAALWPGRRATRRSYAEALAQRNALLSRGRSDSALDAWDAELARHGVALIADRVAAVDAIKERFGANAADLGLVDDPQIRYRFAEEAANQETFAAALAERRPTDLQRGFTTFGPHRDEVVLSLSGRETRTYASQGQQRLSLLSLILAECEAISDITRRRPLVLLDDVMSELDATRRAMLVERVDRLGQCLITATELAHIPVGAGVDEVIEVFGGEARRAGAPAGGDAPSV